MVVQKLEIPKDMSTVHVRVLAGRLRNGLNDPTVDELARIALTALTDVADLKASFHVRCPECRRYIMRGHACGHCGSTKPEDKLRKFSDTQKRALVAFAKIPRDVFAAVGAYGELKEINPMTAKALCCEGLLEKGVLRPYVHGTGSYGCNPQEYRLSAFGRELTEDVDR